MSKYSEAKAKFWGLPVPPHLIHGQNRRAGNIYGCDCELCLPSGRRLKERGRPLTRQERTRRSRQNLYGKPVPPGVKHGIYTYRVYGCTCEACRAANRAERWRAKNRWRETARGHWSTAIRDGHQVDVIHWPPAELDEPWLCPDCDFRSSSS